MMEKMFLVGRKNSILGITHRVIRKRISSFTDRMTSRHQGQWRCMSFWSEGSIRKEYNYRQQYRFLQSEETIVDSEKKTGVSKSLDRLWEEMSPETRDLAGSIISEIPSSGAENDVHPNKSTDRKSTSTGIHPRVAISRAITLMESKLPSKKKQGDLLLTYLLSLSSTTERQGKSINASSFSTPTLRVGFAGPPGVGKSSMMETFGMYLLEQDPELKLAVVCIDPSSNISGGSILGDKTRMTRLSREVDRALVRPSCNSGILGGLAAYTDDVVRLLGCAGYPLVLVETVGLGQSEIEVAQSVDILVLLVSPSGGDELQGVKKGIVEMANILAVTKDDGDLRAAVDRTAADYKGALRVLHQSSSSNNNCGDKGGRWMPPVVKTSSVKEHGLDDLWKTILDYQNHLLETGKWHIQRQEQAKYWMWQQFSRMIQVKIRGDLRLREKANQLEQRMLQGSLTPRVAAQILQNEMFDSVTEG